MPWTVVSQPQPSANPQPRIPEPTPHGPLGAGPDPSATPAPLQTTGGWVVDDNPLTPLQIMRRSPDVQQAVQELARKRDVPWQQLQTQVAQRAATERKPIMQVIQEMGGSGTLPQRSQGPALPQAQQVQPPGPAFAPAASAPGLAALGPPTQQPGILQQLGQGDIFGAARTGIREAWQGATRPITWGLGILGKPAELTEQFLTGGQGYDKWLQQHGITDPTERFIFGTAAKIVLDPTNILLFPGAVEKGLSIAGRVATGGYRLAKATGVPEAAARSIGLIERGLLDSPTTGPSARLVQAGFNQIRTKAAAARDMAFSMFDKTYKMPSEFRDMYRAWQGRTVNVVEQGEQELKRIVGRFEEGDRQILYNALRGQHDLETLSPELRAEYDRLDGIRTRLTKLGVDQGFIEHTIDNYVRRLYDPQTMAELDSIARSGMAKEGLRGPLGKQILPGPGAFGTSTRAGMRRIFDTDEAAEAAGKKVIQDVALSIPAHIWEFGFAHNTADFLRDVAELDETWAAKQAGREPLVMSAAEAPADWVKFETILGGPTAERTKLWAREGETGGPVVAVSPDVATATESSGRALSGERKLADLRASPRFAEWAKDTLGVRGDVPDYMRLYGRVAGDVKRIVFWNALVHGGNVLRSVFLADGFKGFNPTRWMEMYHDGQNFGPWSRAFYRFGGSTGTGLESKMSTALDEVMSAVGPAKQALEKAGINWQELRKAPLKIPGAIKEFSDHVLWQGFDKTGRLQAFRDFAEGAGIKEADLANLTLEQQQKLAEGADLTNKFLNNYSRTAMTRFEKGLANVFFTYAWNKGRLQLFGDMARSYAPWTALSAGERAAYQRGAMRWAITNMVIPHFVRAMRAQASDGIWGAPLEVGQQTRAGYTSPLYMDYTGFYSDTQQFIKDPIGWAWARSNPLVRSLFDVINAVTEGRVTGKSSYEAAGDAAARFTSDYVPAGFEQLAAPGRPWYTRLMPWAGLPVTTVPPRPEDPRIQMHEAIAKGDFGTAAAIIRRARLGLLYTTGHMPADQRRQIMEMDRILFPQSRGGGGGIGLGLNLGLGISSQDLLK